MGFFTVLSLEEFSRVHAARKVQAVSVLQLQGIRDYIPQIQNGIKSAAAEAATCFVC